MRLLGLDRGSKKIGIARWASTTRISFPLGFVRHDEHTVTTLAHYIITYQIDTIVYGFVHSKRLRTQLSLCKEQLTLLFPKIERVGCNEAYTSVQADILLESPHHPGQDSVAAMYILETYIDSLGGSKDI